MTEYGEGREKPYHIADSNALHIYTDYSMIIRKLSAHILPPKEGIRLSTMLVKIGKCDMTMKENPVMISAFTSGGRS